MNLDDLERFNEIDSEDMLSQIMGLPDQLLSAWDLGINHFDLPDWSGIRQVLIAGMGGSAIGADLLKAFAYSHSDIPIIVHRDYGLPAWAQGRETLVIASSHSGNTEETLSAFSEAITKDCCCLAVATGGELAEQAKSAGTPLWIFTHTGQPRAAVGYSFSLLLAAFTRIGILSDFGAQMSVAVNTMLEQQQKIATVVPAATNPAKRLAGQLIGRWVTVIGSGILAPVARRWKGQISEIAKSWAQFEYLPEADHNTLAGIHFPEDLFSRHMVLFLRAASDHPRNRLRTNLTQNAFMLQGIGTDFVDAKGDTTLEHLWTCLHFGDYVAYYLAMAYGVDPTPVDSIENFKREMKVGE
jgi:glucose/mannose-6-phosphate isomerase